jgi:hexosaminidase
MTSWSTSGVYSPAYESEDDLVELYALRHVYPITGFDILISAYIKAINSDHPLNIDQFIIDYCRSEFGFDKSQLEQFQKALFTAPYTITNGKVNSPSHMTVNDLLDSVHQASKIFHMLRPEKNIKMFNHYQLMADIRVYYLNFMEIEKEVNSENFSRSKIPGYLTRLKVLMNREAELDKRFRILNQDVLYRAAIDEENNLRNQKIHNLYNRLSGIK